MKGPLWGYVERAWALSGGKRCILLHLEGVLGNRWNSRDKKWLQTFALKTVVLGIFFVMLHCRRWAHALVMRLAPCMSECRFRPGIAAAWYPRAVSHAVGAGRSRMLLRSGVFVQANARRGRGETAGNGALNTRGRRSGIERRCWPSVVFGGSFCQCFSLFGRGFGYCVCQRPLWGTRWWRGMFTAGRLVFVRCGRGHCAASIRTRVVHLPKRPWLR
jgi:hypothetical protein